MRAHMVVMILSCLVVSIVASTVWAGDCETVVISGSPKYPPFSWQDKTNPDTLVGITIEMAERAFEELGIPTKVVYAGPWKRTLYAAQQGEVDMIAGLYFNDERSTYLEYITPPVMMDIGVVFVKKGQAFEFTSWDDLIGKTGGMILGDSRGKDFDVFAKEKLTLEEVSKVELMFKKVEAGRNDYMLYGLYSGLAKADELGFSDVFEALPMPISEEGMFLTISKKSPCQKYAKDLKTIIEKFKQEQLAESLAEKYLLLWKEQIAQ